MGLWEVLRAGGGAQNVAHAEKLTGYAAGKLILVRDAFPDYTMHDERHTKNVIARMEDLLGSRIEKVTPLEAAMLILAAYFHDIGMVYHPDELAALGQSEDFRAFLDGNPAAYVAVHEAGQIPGDVIVQYCRARHAQRVDEHVFRFESDELFWDGAGIADELARLCRSHNEPLDRLRDRDFPTNFLGQCDLRMCAILLRLADILDLDESRSPLAVYEHLRLAAAAEGPRAVSNTEWAKHMGSCGFRFPPDRPPNYPLDFLASPRQPAVEHAIRKFLDVVEEELRGCRVLLDFCAPRWQSLPLPGSVQRNIKSIGYRYGEYRFSLDRHAVLRLFMGDQLYRDPYVFIRELLQNAVDACRLNVYLHDVPREDMEVRVSAWEDADGFYWLRVDDTGVGMDQGIVEKYFLGVGRSYYRSDELQADILRKNKPQQKFTAISRFGIGVLSSFIVGDRIEVSTRRRRPGGALAAPLRLSLHSLDDFFVMQVQPNKPAPFPGRAGWDDDYRPTPGTSVAVRIDPAKSDVSLHQLTDTARKAFFYPPVRVLLNDVEGQVHSYADLDTPLLDQVARSPFAVFPAGATEARRSASDTEPLMPLAASAVTILAIPLNLTAAAPSPAIRGQLIAFTAEATGGPSLLPALPAIVRDRLPAPLARSLSQCIVGHRATVGDTRFHDLGLTLSIDCRGQAIDELLAWLSAQDADLDNSGADPALRGQLADLAAALSRARIPEAMRPASDEVLSIQAEYPFSLDEIVDRGTAAVLTGDWLGHNGIRVSTSTANGLDLRKGPELVLAGPVCLFDELRPDVSVSRDALRQLSFGIQSALHLAVRRAASGYLSSPVAAHARAIMDCSLLPRLPGQEVTSGQIGEDRLLPQWRAERLIPLAGGSLCNTAEARQLASAGPVDLGLKVAGWHPGPVRYASGFYRVLSCALAELDLDIEIRPGESGPTWKYFVPAVRPTVTVCGPGRPGAPAGLSVLPPLTMARYQTPDFLLAPGWPINLRHPIGAWFADHAALLRSDYPAFLAQFRRALRGLNDEMFYFAMAAQDESLDLLNATLDRVRRAFPEDAHVLAGQVYADEKKRLRTRS